MRMLALFLMSLAVGQIANADPAPAPSPVSINDVARVVSERDFVVLENAQRVYQAKEAIRAARGSLLPRLNLWTIADAAAGIASAIYGGAWAEGVTSGLGVIQDVAPFLVPANWFRLEETKILYQAEIEAYRALWGNEVMSAKELYLQVLMDHSLLDQIDFERATLALALERARLLQLFRGGDPELAREIEIRKLELELDRKNVERLLVEERAALSYSLGLPAGDPLELVPVELPELDRFSRLAAEDFEFRVLDSSPEIREYERLLEVIPFIRKEVVFAFLGGSESSRGVAGGVFDDIPIQGGLGFDTKATLKIVDSQERILKLQLEAIRQVLLRQLQVAISRENLDLESYPLVVWRAELTGASMESLQHRLRFGAEMDVRAFVEASRNHLQSRLALEGLRYRFLMNREWMERLLLQGDYEQGLGESAARLRSNAKEWLAELVLAKETMLAEPSYGSLKTYFGLWNAGVRGMARDKGARRLLSRAFLKKGAAAICESAFVTEAEWRELHRSCEQEGYFVCSNSVRDYPKARAEFRKILSEKAGAAFDSAKACEFTVK